jgi:hypothetical protein
VTAPGQGWSSVPVAGSSRTYRGESARHWTKIRPLRILYANRHRKGEIDWEKADIDGPRAKTIPEDEEDWSQHTVQRRMDDVAKYLSWIHVVAYRLPGLHLP